MAITVKAFPAKNGECILLDYDADTKRHILIDCGYTETFDNYLRQALAEVNDKGHDLDNFIITHIDADHIQGAISFLKANNAERIVDIRSVWHNTFRHLFDNQRFDDNNDTKSIILLERIVKRGYNNDSIPKENGEISAKQGTSVGALLLKGGYAWNTEFSGKAASVENRQEIVLDSKSSIYLLSPNESKLDALRTLWSDELSKFDIKYSRDASGFYDDAFEMLMSWQVEPSPKISEPISASNDTIERLISQSPTTDTTATNGSSIAFILSVKDRNLLFLGDAHPDLVLDSLRTFQTNGVIIFDLIKISHHGSFGNISRELLHKADARRYLILTNGGRHNHPDKATIAHIIARPSGFIRELFFNYKTINSEFFNRDDWKISYGYSINYLDQEPYSITIE